MNTVNFKSLGISLQYDDEKRIEGFDDLGHLFCCESAYEDHKKDMMRIAMERNNGEVGSVLRYSQKGKKEWYTAPSIKVFWSADWE